MRDLPTGRFAAVVAAAVMSTALAVAGPAAAQAGGYEDVPEDAYFSVPVSALAQRGVFSGTGCGEGFCPDEPLDRKTMAVWIVRVLDDQDPPAVTQSRFNDVDASSFHAPFIERMVQLGVTQGCGNGSGYCPDLNVNRAQMATFLSRGYDLPDGPEPDFGDVPHFEWYADHVARLVASGITLGCGDGTNFCPERDTTRGQMATFLYRAENPSEPDLPSGGSDWERAEGESEEGSYVEFWTSVDLTEVRWRPRGLALIVRCTEDFDREASTRGPSTRDPNGLDVFAFGYGRLTWFWGEEGVIEYKFGDEARSTVISAVPSQDNNSLFVPDDEEERFLEAMEVDTSGRLFLSLFDQWPDGTLDHEVAAELPVAGYREHVQPIVEDCTSARQPAARLRTSR